MSNSSSHIIRLSHVHAGYKERVILSDVNASVPEGSITAILGLNGSGKSTLLRTLCGLQSTLDGEVFVKERLLSQYTPRDLSKIISIVLTGRGEMVQSLFVYEVLAMARAPHHHWLMRNASEDEKIIMASAETAGIMHLLDRRLYTLSDGELQLVSIARAVAQETPVIVLDEPTSHLDIINKLQVFNLLRKLSSQGKTIVFTSHELDMSFEIADYALLISKSGEYAFGQKQQLINDDIPAAFFTSPQLSFDKESGKFNYTL